MDYLRAVLNSNKEQEASYLKRLISIGAKLNINTTKYQNELKKLNITDNKITKATQSKTIQKVKVSQKHDISSVYTKENAIIINYNRVVSKRDIDFIEERTKTDHQDIFDLRGVFENAYETKLKMDGVDKIVIVQKDKNTVRIILKHEYNLKTIYIINNNQIIIKVLNLHLKEKLSTSLTNNYFNQKKKIIVIDPGHGGKDSGAVGPKKRYEKVVVFKVSKYLYDYLKKRGYTVYLTRKSDKFIQLKNRTHFANVKNADIFISIHVNAVPKSKAHKVKGIETFFLSPARSERAKRVAKLENKSDMDEMNYNSQMTFLTILNQSKITASNKLAIDIQQNLLYKTRQKYSGIVDGGVREGPFWVLVGAQMPAILVELGYISHPSESRRLYNRHYQKLLAEGLANGIDAYFSKNF